MGSQQGVASRLGVETDASNSSSQKNYHVTNICVKDRRLELTLGCDAYSHHEVLGSTNTNLRESLLRLQMGNELHILTRGTYLPGLNKTASNRYYHLHTRHDEHGERLKGF
jgi:hypothetical protein